MRAPKRLGPLVLAATLYTMSMGAEASSAELHLFVGMCKANETLLCSEGNKISFKSGKFLLINTNTEIKGVLTEKCTGSQGEGNVLEEMGNPLNIEITSLSFTGCSPCTTMKSEGLPYKAGISMNTEGGTDYQMTSPAKFKLTGCPFGLECTYGSSPSVTFKVENTLSGAAIKAEEEPLENTGGSAFLCGSEPHWTAPYVVRWDLKSGGTVHNVWFMLLPFF